MTSPTRAASFPLAVAACIVLTVLTCLSPVRAQLSAEQKDKIRDALPSPGIPFVPAFNFTEKGGFQLSLNDETNTQSPKTLLALLQKIGLPQKETDRLRYFRTVGDLQSVLNDESAKDTYDKGEKLALVLAKTSASSLRARFLALAAGFHKDQGEDKEAAVFVEEALKLAPDTWEAWKVQAALRHDRIGTLIAPKSSNDLLTDVQNWIDSKPTAEAQAAVMSEATESMAAIEKAIALQEKMFPKAENRNPAPYFLRMTCYATLNALGESLSGQKNGKPVLFGSRFQQYLSDDRSVRDLGKAAECEPDNAYAIATIYFLRARKSGSEEGDSKLFKAALVELSALEKKSLPNKETRVRVLETQTIFSVIIKDWGGAETKAKAVWEIAPNRTLFLPLYPLSLIKQKKFAEAEVIASKLVAKEDTTLARLILARVQIEQNDFVGAERTLAPLYERDKSTVEPAVFLATVRLKATKADTSDADWSALLDLLQSIGTDYQGKMDNYRTEYGLAIATFYALKDQVEDAKALLQRILDSDKENKPAKELLALLP